MIFTLTSPTILNESMICVMRLIVTLRCLDAVVRVNLTCVSILAPNSLSLDNIFKMIRFLQRELRWELKLPHTTCSTNKRWWELKLPHTTCVCTNKRWLWGAFGCYCNIKILYIIKGDFEVLLDAIVRVNLTRPPLFGITSPVWTTFSNHYGICKEYPHLMTENPPIKQKLL